MREFYEETGFCNALFSGQYVLSGRGRVAVKNQNGEKHEGWVSTSVLGVASLYRSALSLSRALSPSRTHTHICSSTSALGVASLYFCLFCAIPLPQTHTLSASLHHGPLFGISLSRSLFRALLFSLTQTQTLLCLSHTNSFVTHKHTLTRSASALGMVPHYLSRIRLPSQDGSLVGGKCCCTNRLPCQHDERASDLLTRSVSMLAWQAALTLAACAATSSIH